MTKKEEKEPPQYEAYVPLTTYRNAGFAAAKIALIRPDPDSQGPQTGHTEYERGLHRLCRFRLDFYVE